MSNQSQIQEKNKFSQDIKVVAGFPGVGRTFFVEQFPNHVSNLNVSSFKWSEKEFQWSEKEKNPQFPQNYIDTINSEVASGKLVLVSTHPEVLDLLKKQDYRVLLVYPKLELKYEYLFRHYDRFESKRFISEMKTSFQHLITNLSEQEGFCHYQLQSEQYLLDLKHFIFPSKRWAELGI
jgi:hypothetical protein